uniref:Nucleolar protein 16 n=1 Tax=Mesocestoides corti TaxID=53468 RepID=A0A5K3FRA2_MESCO
MSKKNTYNYSKNRRKERRKQKKPIFVHNEIVRKRWKGNLSIKDNFAKLGLAFNSNEAVQDAESKVTPETQIETKTIKELKRVKQWKKCREKFISEDDRLFSMYLLEIYGDDYVAMSKDPKNVYQLTPLQMKRMLNTFRDSKYYAQYITDKQNNNLRVVQLYE